MKFLGIAILMFLSTCTFLYCGSEEVYKDWHSYHGDVTRNHYSSADEINVLNVGNLKPAWTYRVGGADTINNTTQMQCNPLIIKGILYGVSPDHQAFAMNASNGKPIWKTQLPDKTFNMSSRGLTYWENEKGARLFFGFGSFLYALDPSTGEPILSFGKKGKINLVEGIQRKGADEYAVLNTPVTVYKNNVIVGSRVSEGPTALLGDIRSFDAISGKLRWRFETIPGPGTEGYETWEPHNYETTGGANNWMGMALDEERGTLYAPTGSASFDFYGGNRKGDNLYANCLLALDANTGEKLWHFQTVHHDIWDRDIPAPPNLFTIIKDGKKIDVVSVLSKQGFVFVFDRDTGKPIYPIEERAVPASSIEGELAAETQPFPVLPKPFTKQSFTASDVNKWSIDYDKLVKEVSEVRTGQAYLPIGRKRTVVYPGTDGGAQWGGAAVDPNGVMYIPAKQNPVYTTLRPNKTQQNYTSNSQAYDKHCQSCHGEQKQGSEDGTYPGLQQAHKKYSLGKFTRLLRKGRGRMPAFSNLTEEEIQGIYAWLNGEVKPLTMNSEMSESSYKITGYNRWYDSQGYPISEPPWGTLTAIDMNTAKHLWQVPLGIYPELVEKGIPATGTDNYGGPAVTAGGLLFIGATKDKYFRALNAQTGEVLFEYKLPAAAYASPSVYEIKGKQYIVIACGGGKLKSKSGDYYLAFSL